MRVDFRASRRSDTPKQLLHLFVINKKVSTFTVLYGQEILLKFLDCYIQKRGWFYIYIYMSHSTTKCPVHPAKTQISLGTAQSDQSLLCPLWVALDPNLLQPGAVARSEASSLGMQAALSWIPTSGTFFRGDLVMKTFLWPFSLFR